MQALGAKDFATLTQDQFDQDDPELVEFLTRQTLPRRGILAREDEILITMGAQNALWLAAELLTKGRRVAVEDPCYPAMRRLLQQAGAAMRPVPVDQDGLPPDLIPEDTQVIFCTPSHQCPTSATMPRARRAALLARAAEMGAVIIEDDYEFEMAFLRPASPALKSLDEDGRVIHVGSFSKSLFPGLRLGYLVGAPAFIRQARALRASVLRHPPGHIQRTVAHFLSLGHYDALISRMGRSLGERRTVMEAAIARHGLQIAGGGTHGGSSFWMQAPEGVDTRALARRVARDRGPSGAGGPFFSAAPPRQGLYRLGFSSISAARIEEGIKRIAQALAPGAAGS